MSTKNQIKLTATTMILLALMAVQVMADSNANPVPTLGPLDGKMFVCKLTPKISSATKISAEEKPAIINETIVFKEGKLVSESFAAKGYESCPYTAKKDSKGYSFTVKCVNQTNPKQTAAWTGKVTNATASTMSKMTGTVKLMDGKNVVTEYAIAAEQMDKPDIPASDIITLAGTFQQTKDGCFFINTGKENIALQLPITILPENIGRQMTAKGTWSMLTVMRCGMNKELVVETFEFTSELPLKNDQ